MRPTQRISALSTLLLTLLLHAALLLIAGPVRAENFPDKPPDRDFFVDKAYLLAPEDSANILANKLVLIDD